MLTDFDDRVAVITGAGSGFGREFARIAHGLGMRLALADIDAQALAATVAGLGEIRPVLADQVLTERVDVSIGAQVDQFAARGRAAFGQVDLLFNNAGVGTGGLIWENSVSDWEWVLGVNLWGVIHGIRAFVPDMLAQKTAGHVVNTASVAGLLSPPLMGVYNVSKHAVVTATETLYHDLRQVRALIGCSLLCPAFVPTGIATSERNRPPGDAPPAADTPSQALSRLNTMRAVRAGRMGAAEVASLTFDAIRSDRFYILTHPKILDSVRLRHADIEGLRAPSDPYGQRTDSTRTDGGGRPA